MPVDRRDLFRIIGSGLVAQSASAQHEHRTPTTKQGPYEPRVFSAGQYATLQRLLDILLPADESSPGAREAGVGMYIDTTLKYGDEKLRDTWIAGLNSIDRIARKTAEKTFTQLDLPAATEVLSQVAQKETQPETEAEKFFVLFKRSAIDAYYLSDAGRKSLGYAGDKAIRDFPGCTHTEHKTSAMD